MPTPMPFSRKRILGAALAGAVVVLATLTYLPHAVAGPIAAPGAASVSGSPTAPSEPTPGPTEPTASPSPEPPDEACEAADALPARLPAANRVAPVALLADGDEVTCKFPASQVTVTWDGENVTIQPAGRRKFGKLRCSLDPSTVKVIEPEGAKVYKDGSIDVPYDKTSNKTIIIKIKYTVECPTDGFIVKVEETVTVEFTPPNGPVEINRVLP